MGQTILEIIALVSASALVLAGGNIMLTPKTEDNRTRLDNLTYVVIYSAGIFTVVAFILGALKL